MMPSTDPTTFRDGERNYALEDDLRKTFLRRVDALAALIKKHPLATVGVSLGLGYLLARFVHRDGESR